MQKPLSRANCLYLPFTRGSKIPVKIPKVLSVEACPIIEMSLSLDAQFYQASLY
jgi:hypothetical protein